MNITLNSNVEIVSKIIISFIPTHKFESGDISLNNRVNEEDLLCSKWKIINPKKENLMKNPKFLEDLNVIIPIDNKFVLCCFKGDKNTLYACLHSPIIMK